MAVRWKLDAPETGLRRIGALPRGSYLHDGRGANHWILRVQPLRGKYRGAVKGWYWYGLGQNTRHNPAPTMEAAKAEALAFYKEYVAQEPT
jgi:hypothetical protein